MTHYGLMETVSDIGRALDLAQLFYSRTYLAISNSRLRTDAEEIPFSLFSLPQVLFGGGADIARKQIITLVRT